MSWWGALVQGAVDAGKMATNYIMSARNRRKANAWEAQRIRMLVNDARAAGIHPLAAMGAASGYQNPHGLVPSATPIGFDNVGGAFSEALDRKGEASDRELRKRQLDLEERRVRLEEKAFTINSARDAVRDAVRGGAVPTVYTGPGSVFSGSGGSPVPVVRAEAGHAVGKSVYGGPNPDTAVGVEEWVPYLIMKGHDGLKNDDLGLKKTFPWKQLTEPYRALVRAIMSGVPENKKKDRPRSIREGF